MKVIRILIVEDIAALADKLENMYRQAFQSRNMHVSIEKADTVEKARDLARAAEKCPYDLVSLDVNLGNAALTGLDVLTVFNRFQSAWMISLLTGVETDETLTGILGEEKAEGLRRRLRRDAYARFPSERLLVVEKPSTTLSNDDANELLANRIEQITLVYEEVSRQRYIFRPLEVVSLTRMTKPKGAKGPREFMETSSLHWQIRFDCGQIRTLPDMAGFKTLHHLLSMDLGDSLTPEQAMVIEPKAEKKSDTWTAPTDSALDDSVAEDDPVAKFFLNQGIEWHVLSDAEQEKLINAALALRFRRYTELRELEEEDDISPDEADELSRITRELGPLAGLAEIAHRRINPRERDVELVDDGDPEIVEQAYCIDPEGEEIALVEDDDAGVLAQNELHQQGGIYTRNKGRWGTDSPEAMLFRARMKRVKDCLRENGFQELATHLESYVMPNRANWSYIRPDGIEWTT